MSSVRQRIKLEGDLALSKRAAKLKIMQIQWLVLRPETVGTPPLTVPNGIPKSNGRKGQEPPPF
jgi:hypothetical protein